jgi:hypothetical protein
MTTIKYNHKIKVNLQLLQIYIGISQSFTCIVSTFEYFIKDYLL